ncbi:sensor histidine kinase [Roseateles cavernae]|uniref:sensor histidine kinase n=1 Tax=Roseateles cavernae TaxID=3153578 RepID=UPI0032E48494
MSAETAPPPAHRSLFNRTMGAVFAVIFLTWAGLIVRELADISLLQSRNGQAENKLWAQLVRAQLQDKLDDPAAINAALGDLEELRNAEWRQKGHRTPHSVVQVWQHGQLRQQLAPPDPKDRAPPQLDRLESDKLWLYTEASAPEQGLTVRRWQEMPGDWHFSVKGFSYYARPLLYGLPLLVLPVWLLFRRGFAPLRRIGAQISQRSAKDLSPLPSSPYVELAPVVNSVNALMNRLQQRLEREREFLLDAAHELKTPLAVIQLNAEQLEGSAATARQAEAAQRLTEGVKRATHTVHQLLALARSGADLDAMDMREHDLVTLTRDRIVLASQLALRRGIEVELSAPEECRIRMNRENMGSLIDNLVDNAVKYSPPGSQVLVRLAPQPEGGLGLSVCDQGPGIPVALRQKVFERFFRLHDGEQPGSGLGLAIVERAAAQHGAQLRMDDGPDGRGLCVSLSFPAAPA